MKAMEYRIRRGKRESERIRVSNNENWIAFKKNIAVIKSLGNPVVTYSFSIINWNLNELKKIDTKNRKQLTRNRMHHREIGVDSLYLPGCSGGGETIQLELSKKITEMRLVNDF